jgi:NAD(P)-dependent dehydrogenase (short-subunit alcohol dehydrogenase family)
MDIAGKVFFISGANRGIGKALVEISLRHGARKVYACARNLEDLTHFKDPRVVPLFLDITKDDQVKKAVDMAQDTQILINNAGTLARGLIVEASMEEIIRDMEVNYFGTLRLTRAFVPILKKNTGSAIASISSIVGLTSMSSLGGYCASKAALFSAMQSIRRDLKPYHISVFNIFPGPIDTDMAREMDISKTSPREAAENILIGMQNNHEDIFPDPMSQRYGALWMSNPKELERQFSF